jgi:putative ATP-binding cassette transporter
LLTLGLAAVVIMNAFFQVRLNNWQGAFYDSIAGRDVPTFFRELGVFAIIISGLLTLTVSQTGLHELLKVKLRQSLASDLFDQWLVPKRAYLLQLLGEVAINPDQRVQEDARRLTDLTADLAIGLLQASVLLVSFVGLLWVLSSSVMLPIAGQPRQVPGYMVWCALGYAIAGSWLTWRTGRPLVKLNIEQRAREAEFRFALVHVSESAEGIALYRGEADGRRLLDKVLGGVIAKMREIVAGIVRLTWVTSGYGWIAIVVPVVVAAPGYFAGTLTLGGLMMVVGAFYQVQQSLRWYVDNFPRIAEWRAALARVMAFRDAIARLETLGNRLDRIEYVSSSSANLVLEDICVLAPHGQLALDEPRIEIAPGDRVLIVGGVGAGKSTFFRALAGLWPWGHGKIYVPQADRVMFLPHRPYLPLGSLRTTLTIRPRKPISTTRESAPHWNDWDSTASVRCWTASKGGIRN